MAEVVGVISSVLAISEAVIGSVKLASELYRAPEEIRALDEQVRSFRSLINQIYALAPSGTISLESVLSQPLSRAQDAIRELDFLLRAKLLKQGQGSNRARRRAWLRHKTSVTHLRSKLRDAREILLVGLNTYLIICTQRLESSLVSIDHQATENHFKAIDAIERRMELKKVKGPLLSEVPVASPVQARWQSCNQAMMHKSPVVKSTQPYMRSGYFFDTPISLRGAGRLSRVQEVAQYSLPQTQEPQTEDSLDNNESKDAALVTAFVTSPSFLPETYTTQEAKPDLFSHSSRLDQVFDFTRTNQYAMFYEHSPREWSRLTVSVTISIDSPYWHAMWLSGGNDVLFQPCFGLPTSLNNEFRKFLKQNSDLKSDSHFCIFLGGSDKPTIHYEKSILPVTEHLKKATRVLRHFDCPWYSERNLIHHPIGSSLFNREFIAFVGSRWLLEYRFGSERSEVDASLYMLQALHCLKGLPGINPFFGLIIDEPNGIAKGFLTDLPAKGYLFRLLTQPVIWHRREKWCKQIVQGVAEAHSKGFVVGSLGLLSSVAFMWMAMIMRYFIGSKPFPTSPSHLPEDYRPSIIS